MSLVSDIINDIVDPKSSTSSILLKAKVLAYKLGLNEFKEWAENELNGYKDRNEIPPYRRFQATNLAHLIGPYGSQMPEVPIPLSNLPDRIREAYKDVVLTESIAALDSFAQHNKPLKIDWVADVLPTLQDKIYLDYACYRAWQVVSPGHILNATNAVRDKLLTFALELQERFPDIESSEVKFGGTTNEQVRQVFTTIIFGSGNRISTANSQQNNYDIQVNLNDMDGLLKTLRTLGITEQESQELQKAIEEDGQQLKTGEFGAKVSQWLGKLCTKAVDTTSSFCVEHIIKAILAYYGLSS